LGSRRKFRTTNQGKFLSRAELQALHSPGPEPSFFLLFSPLLSGNGISPSGRASEDDAVTQACVLFSLCHQLQEIVNNDYCFQISIRLAQKCLKFLAFVGGIISSSHYSSTELPPEFHENVTIDLRAAEPSQEQELWAQCTPVEKIPLTLQ